MEQASHNTVRWLLLTLALTLIALVMLALACGPAVPTSTPEPTRYHVSESPFNPYLAARVAMHKAQAAKGGDFSGQSGPYAEERVPVKIYTTGFKYFYFYNFPLVMRYLKEQGVTPSLAIDGPEEGVIEAEITTEMMIEISNVWGDVQIWGGSGYKGLNGDIGAAYALYDAGLRTAEEAAASLGGSVGLNISVLIWVDNPAGSGNTDRVVQFLKDNGITPRHVYRPYIEGSATDAVATFVSWSLLPELAKLSGVSIRNGYSPPSSPGEMRSPEGRPSGAANPADAHGAAAWQTNTIEPPIP